MAKPAKLLPGQPGYSQENWSDERPPQREQGAYKPAAGADAPREIQIDESERGPTEIKPKPKREPSPIAEKPARVAKGSELWNYLKESGTNVEKIEDARLWLIDNDVSAEKLFRYLESAEDRGHQPISLGTLRKAGKWLWGDTWEPETAVLEAPADEIKKLRQEIATMLRADQVRSAELSSLRQQLAYLQQQNTNQAGQLDYLKAGRSPDDLAALGIDAGRNLTAAM